MAFLGEEASRLGGQRALVVSDRGVSAAGHSERVLWALTGSGLKAELFDEVPENPTTVAVAQGAAAAAAFGADLLVAVGGGSALDCAKGINFLVSNGGKMEDYWGWAKAARPMLPSIGIPTTAGTGSEAQSYALITQAQAPPGDAHGRKMACGDPKARFRLVLLDPQLALTAPAPVRAAAGIDAVAHAVESFVTRRRNPVSSLLAREAWNRLSGQFALAVSPRPSAAGLAEMLFGAHLAGAAIEASMLGAAHAAANPLTARYGIAHGQAVGLMLPTVVRWNAQGPAGELYRELSLGGAEEIALAVAQMLRTAGLPERLSALDVRAEELPELAGRARQEWTGGFNPRPVSEEDFLRLYEAAF
ncbi:MAG TPA: iron-containing alcohol dehydrogenase [Thermoanaerobaculia bacterium]|nr:iron-containing alcohol dehydrogenase [Thermoanaerobaculia bacterium]